MTKKIKPNLTSLLAYLVEAQAESNKNQARTNELLTTLIGNSGNPSGNAAENVPVDVGSLVDEFLVRTLEKVQIINANMGKIDNYKRSVDSILEIVERLGNGILSASAHIYRITPGAWTTVTFQVPEHLVGKVALVHVENGYNSVYIISSPSVLEGNLEFSLTDLGEATVKFIILERNDTPQTLEIISTRLNDRAPE